MSDASASERTRRIVEILNSVRSRKAMYFSPVTVEAADTFLGGFVVGCLASGSIDRSGIVESQQARGWQIEAYGVIPQMRERGMTDEQMIDELIDIHIDAFAQRGESK